MYYDHSSKVRLKCLLNSESKIRGEFGALEFSQEPGSHSGISHRASPAGLLCAALLVLPAVFHKQRRDKLSLIMAEG